MGALLDTAYVASYASQGDLRFVTLLEGDGTSRVTDAAVGEGGVWTVGRFEGSLAIGAGLSSDDGDTFVVRLAD